MEGNKIQFKDGNVIVPNDPLTFDRFDISSKDEHDLFQSHE